MIDHDDIAELRAEANAQRRRQRAFFAHPDCRDPDHPGCTACDDTHNDNQDDD